MLQMACGKLWGWFAASTVLEDLYFFSGEL